MTDYWRPETLDDLRSFIDGGVARESRWVEFKRELPRNRALARQLAAFAIEGGSIVIGVAEEADNKFSVVPIPIAGLRERVEQIAQSVVEPPLWVASRVLADNDGENGVLWIDVPQSPDAPHQVDGTYYERGDTQARPMSDAAVERLMRSRSSSLDDILDELHEGLKDNPRSQFIGRTCIVAKPIGAAQQELYDASGGQAGWHGFATEVQRARSDVQVNESLHESLFRSPETFELARTYEGLVSALSLQLRSLHSPKDNWGMLEAKQPLLPFRNWAPFEYCKLVLSDDGSLRCTTYSQSPGVQSVGPRYLQPGLAIATCLTILAVLRLIRSKTGKGRVWDVAIGVADVRNSRAMPLLAGHLPIPDIPYSDRSYTRPLRVTDIQLENDPWGIARDLTQRFVEGCGLDFDGEARVLGYEP